MGANLTRCEARETLEKFRGNPLEFEQTFETPLQNLQAFVEAIVSVGEGVKAGSLTIDQVVFEPKALVGMLTSHSIPPTYERGLCLTATGQKEVEELLRAVLSEWIDFLFIPESQSFAIYADHDEFTTFYAHSRANLDRMVRGLSDRGFKVVVNYKRRF